MIDEAVERIIEDYLRSIRKVLPDSFETDDLVDDLRSHIIESYQHKTEQKPDTDRIALIRDVLDEIGEPEEIAEGYRPSPTGEEPLEGRRKIGTRVLLRLIAAVAVIIIAAAIAATITEGALDFGLTVVILLIFVVAEWFARAWQAGEITPLDV
ncbi:MAG: HAAS signaling domain-containing protein, partial [Candidatus Thorarchaeota archaeon]